VFCGGGVWGVGYCWGCWGTVGVVCIGGRGYIHYMQRMICPVGHPWMLTPLPSRHPRRFAVPDRSSTIAEYPSQKHEVARPARRLRTHNDAIRGAWVDPEGMLCFLNERRHAVVLSQRTYYMHHPQHRPGHCTTSPPIAPGSPPPRAPHGLATPPLAVWVRVVAPPRRPVLCRPQSSNRASVPPALPNSARHQNHKDQALQPPTYTPSPDGDGLGVAGYASEIGGV
jgi:hypothetical protein